MTQHLEHHAHVGAVHAADLEVVQELDAALPERVLLVALADLKTKTTDFVLTDSFGALYNRSSKRKSLQRKLVELTHLSSLISSRAVSV